VLARSGHGRLRTGRVRACLQCRCCRRRRDSG